MVRSRHGRGSSCSNPDYEIIEGDEEEGGEGTTVHTGRIVPVYEKAGAMTPKMQRRLVYDVLEHLPADLRRSAPRRTSSRACSCPAAERRCGTRTFLSPGARSSS